ncbi:MAG: glycosyltransferase [Planctomycetia bacterium]
MDQEAVIAAPDRVAMRPQAPREPGGEARPIEISVIMPTVFWTGTFERCCRRVLELIDRSDIAVEAVIVMDGAARPAPAWLDHPAVTIVSTGARGGPAAARNRAAAVARGRILFFVDADVELAPDALAVVSTMLSADTDPVAMFGCYDDEPAAQGVVSQFRNLLHHHVHVSHPGRAFTFWSGCGAIRAAAFADVDGFDAGYQAPSVEDIDLGMRLRQQGGEILLVPQLRCKHLKPWTLGSMTFSDVFHRAVPWSRLIVGRHDMPSTLNIDWPGRISGVCSILLAACLPALVFVPWASWVAAACGAVVVVLNAGFLRLCLRKQGLGFAIASLTLLWLFFVYSSVTFGAVVIEGLFAGSRHRAPGTPRTSRPADVPVAG